MLSLIDASGRRTAACALRNSLYLLPAGILASYLGVTTPVFSTEAAIMTGAMPISERVMMSSRIENNQPRSSESRLRKKHTRLPGVTFESTQEIMLVPLHVRPGTCLPHACRCCVVQYGARHLLTPYECAMQVAWRSQQWPGISRAGRTLRHVCCSGQACSTFLSSWQPSYFIGCPILKRTGGRLQSGCACLWHGSHRWPLRKAAALLLLLPVQRPAQAAGASLLAATTALRWRLSPSSLALRLWLTLSATKPRSLNLPRPRELMRRGADLRCPQPCPSMTYHLRMLVF